MHENYAKKINIYVFYSKLFFSKKIKMFDIVA
jgi:hypothetical protein